jgi:hypothetical protein
MAAPIARIEVRLRELAQLFNSMDPSPFLDRDLDGDADEFIVSWARQHPPGCEFELVIHLSAPAPGDRATGLEEAVRHYFGTRAQLKQREFQVLMRHGRLSLLIGVAFMTGCLFAGGFVRRLGTGTGAGFANESLAILGWVAMWRPLQIYLYDWWPLREEQRLFARLARMPVRLVLPA